MTPPNTSCRWRILQHRTPQLLLLSLSLFFSPVYSGLVNITVDDQLGDPTTRLIPQYSPNTGDSWHVGSPSEDCSICHIGPSTLDLTQVYDKTWLDATYWPSHGPATITVHFTGSAVYVFNIVPNTLSTPTNTFADISFSIDGEDVGRFTHSPDSSNNILYNQLVYHNTILNHGPHTLIMTPANASLILFDYLVYTTQTDDTTSTSAPNDTPHPSPFITPTSTSASDGSSHSLSVSPPSTSTSTPKNNPQSSSPGTFSSTSSPHASSQSLSSNTSTSTSTPQGSSQFSSSSTPTSTSIPNGTLQSPSSSSTLVGTVVGAALGGVALLLVIAVGLFFLCRSCRRSRAAQMQVSPADGGCGNIHDSLRGRRGEGDDRGEDGASFAPSMGSTTPISPAPASSLRLFGGAAMYAPPSPASCVPEPDRTRPSLPVPLAASPSMSSKGRAERASWSHTLQRTRSVLSSPTDAPRSDANGGRRRETTIRVLEAEIADLRGVLTSLNARLGDEHRGDPELLPAYAE